MSIIGPRPLLVSYLPYIDVKLNILLFPISHRTEFTTTILFKNENIFYRCIENP